MTTKVQRTKPEKVNYGCYFHDAGHLAEQLRWDRNEVEAHLADLIDAGFLKTLKDEKGFKLLVFCEHKALSTSSGDRVTQTLPLEGASPVSLRDAVARGEPSYYSYLVSNNEGTTTESDIGNGCSTSSNVIPLPPEARYLTRIRRSGSSNPDSPYSLVQYWRRESYLVQRGPRRTNAGALQATFSRWIREEQMTGDEIRCMIDLFLALPAKSDAPVWKRFLSESSRLYGMIRRRADNIRGEIDKSDEYWLGTEKEFETSDEYWLGSAVTNGADW